MPPSILPEKTGYERRPVVRIAIESSMNASRGSSACSAFLGAASISRQENPRRLEMLLNTGLPPGDRVSYFK